MTRDSFVFYRSYKNALNALPTENQVAILNAIIDYALDGIEPQIDGIELAFFELVRPQINANNVKYEIGCKGAEYGKLGGAPKGNQNARKSVKQPQDNPTETPKQPQDNPKTTRNENVNENENENENAASNARAREGSAKEKFFAEFPAVRLNGADDSGVDYTALLEAFRGGNEYLRNTKSMNYITAHYAEIIGGGYRKAAAAREGAQLKANAMQLWQELMQAVERAKELRYDDYTGYDVYLYCRQDESSKKEVEEIYRALPSEVMQRYGKNNFIELCKMDADELKFERARFLKTF